MNRPSLLHVEVDKRDDSIHDVRVGGESVVVCEGSMQLPVATSVSRLPPESP